MRILVLFCIFISLADVQASCKNLRDQSLQILMQKEFALDQAKKTQKIIDELLAVKIAPLNLGKLKDSEYLQINQYCIPVKDINRLLRLYVRSVFELDLTKAQKTLIRKKSILLLKIVNDTRLSSQSILLAYDILLELADADLLSNSKAKKINEASDEFRIQFKKRNEDHIKQLQNAKDRGSLRKAYYREGRKIALEQWKIIAAALPKV